MKNRKILAAVVGAAALAVAGCGSQPGATGGPTASEQPAEKQVMTAMFLGSSQDQAVVDIIQDMTDKFNADNPYNVDFKFETYENELYKTKLTSVMASNSAPDVFFTWSAGFLKPFVAGGKVLEVGPMLDADADWKGRFNEGTFGPVTFDGKVYAVPHGQT
ncbi:MAG: extracellular solute-binding protein, partial [Propionibacteriaceae bacterium]|nr:extracellular solute-binding protein [Propionibacteriaceae bacterium]